MVVFHGGFSGWRFSGWFSMMVFQDGDFQDGVPYWISRADFHGGFPWWISRLGFQCGFFYAGFFILKRVLLGGKAPVYLLSACPGHAQPSAFT